MIVSEKELQLDLPRYLDMAANGDITITRDGTEIATLTRAYRPCLKITPETLKLMQQPKPGHKGLLDQLIGIMPSDITLEEAREERLSKI